MNGVVQPESLKHLARYLQARLEPQTHITPLQVQCAQKETLMVLVQHPPGNAPEPQQIFSILEASLTNLPPGLAKSLLPGLDTTRVKLFLRILGQQKPYAFHGVEIAAPRTGVSEAGSKAVPFQPASNDESQTMIQMPEAQLATLSDANSEATIESSISVSASESEDEILAQVPTLPTDSPSQKSSLATYPSPLTTLIETKRRRRSLVKPLLLTGSGIAVAVGLGLAGYALTRPCVIGSCAAFETAQSLSQQSVQMLEMGQSEDTAQRATQQLTEAGRLVAEIPPWSGQYGNAQTLKHQLDQVLKAEATATAASQKAQVTAQTVTDWQAAQSLWQEAIAQLQAVPSDSPLHAFAQKRLGGYQANLAFVERRIATEQGAQKRLMTARKTVELAIARQNVAQTLQDWQQAQATWQVVVNSLTQIPNGTMAHSEAQQLLATYKPKLTETRDRATKEQLAQKLYTQATNLEKQARAFQQRNQWSQATAVWQNAVNVAKQIPDGTSISGDAQTRAATYAGFLHQAQKVVRVRSDLDNVCLGADRICNYTITNELIQVKFVPAYERKVRTLGGLSQFSGDYDTMYQINIHLATLGRALQTISNNAGTPIQVYNSDNQLLGSFIPGG